MERTIGRDVGIIVMVAIVYLAASMLIENQYYQLMLTLVPVWAILGIAWNVFSGYSGMVSFGHASFFGLGAYTVTLLLVKLDVSPWCGIPIGMVVGVIAGALIGWPAFRLRGPYSALRRAADPLGALMVSGAIAAGIGGFYAVVLLIVTPPSVFGMLTSAQALIVTLFGGVATVWGPVVGSAILIPLAEVLQAELGDKIPGIQGVVFGVAIVLVILLAPEGIVPHIREALRRR